MLKAIDVARYFLQKDTDGTVFTFNLCHRNGHNAYEGNVRLNKYLHISQNLYYAKFGKKLFSDNMLAYDNGAVVKDVYQYYRPLLSAKQPQRIEDEAARDFLDRVYSVLCYAPLDDLIEMSHEDRAWIEKHNTQNLSMDTDKHLDEYKEQYADLLYLMYDAKEEDFDA